MLNIIISCIIIISSAIPCIAENNFYIKHIDTFIVNGNESSTISYKDDIEIYKDEVNTKQIKQENGENKMTFGTWIMIVMVMVVVAKGAHKITMKTFFKPVKASANKVKKEWEEA